MQRQREDFKVLLLDVEEQRRNGALVRGLAEEGYIKRHVPRASSRRKKKSNTRPREFVWKKPLSLIRRRWPTTSRRRRRSRGRRRRRRRWVHAPRQGGRSLYFFPLTHPSYRARIRRTRTFPVLRSGLVNVHRERLFLPRPPPPHPLSSHRGSTTAMYVWWRKMDGEGKRKVHRWVSYLHRPRENFKFLLLYSSFLNFFFFILLFSQEEKWIELYLKRYNVE